METNLTIGVIGNGFVGRATQIFGQSPFVSLFVYDVDPSKCVPQNTTIEQLVEKCNIIFVCVPTPINLETNQSDTSIVKSVITQIQSISNCRSKIICRSTVPPGTCEALGIAHMPEYLTEKNWHNDFINMSTWELGLPFPYVSDYAQCAQDIQRLLSLCKHEGIISSDHLIVQDSKTTEMAKMMRNTMLAVRIAVCNEYEQFCRVRGIDYEEVRKLATSDPRIGSSHTQVPGPDGKRGFGGTCLPKDLKALIGEMMNAGITPFVLSACSIRNDFIDRPDRDWIETGRSVSQQNQNAPH